MGSTLIGSKPGIVDASLHLLLQIPHYIPEQKKFELGVLVSLDSLSFALTYVNAS